jgi:hypothetical protein
MKIRVNVLINAKINKTLQFVVDLRAFAWKSKPRKDEKATTIRKTRGGRED